MELHHIDVSHMVSSKDVEDFISNVDRHLETKGHKGGSAPLFQTVGDIFEEPWAQILRESFMYACRQITNNVSLMPNPQGWCYKTNHETYSGVDAEDLWHDHSIGVSGVFYLRVPDKTGTEFQEVSIPNIVPRELHWHLFQSSWVHRPMKVESEDWRYVLAADMLCWFP